MNVREDLLQRRIDPALTAETLSAIAGDAIGSSVRVTSWRPLTGGCWNRVIGLQGDTSAERLVIKIAPAPGDAGLEREFHVLRWFTAHTRLPVPRAFSVDATGRIIPGSFLVMSRIPGQPLHDQYDAFDTAERRRITIRIAEDIAELHSQTSRGFGGAELAEVDRSDWASFWLPRFDAVLGEASSSGLVEPGFFARVDALRGRLPRILDIGEQSTLTHYDIWSGNIMVDRDAGMPRVSGYLDVPGFWADPVRELSFAEMFGIADRLFYEVYTASHELGDGWELRRSLYNLKMNLKHVTMYPAERYYREGAEACLASLERAAGDPGRR